MPDSNVNINWEQLLTVDCIKAAEIFIPQHECNDMHKLHIRGYSVPFSGTQQRFDDLMDFLRRQLLKYVFPEKERPDDIDWALGRNKFGDNDPKSDGKLGEMLLYVFVEAFLKTPLMAYKLKDMGNPNDQVKGADGVFVGEYQSQKALLIGESKIHETMKSAVKSAIESLQRFHDKSGPYANELMIARKYPAERNLSADHLVAIEEIMQQKAGILVHPVFVSYDFAAIASVARDATNSNDAEISLKVHLKNELAEWEKKIISQKSKFPKPFQVYLDFFFLPVENCLQLRKHFYELLHGNPYESTAVKAAKKKAGRKRTKL